MTAWHGDAHPFHETKCSMLKTFEEKLMVTLMYFPMSTKQLPTTQNALNGTSRTREKCINTTLSTAVQIMQKWSQGRFFFQQSSVE